ncbi:MAG: HIT family protein [Candidatus Cloacimonetes bacterium]|nr:HIT family protein [Candidatus Cloacimonadota bacterium]
MNCVFCAISSDAYIIENDCFFAIKDKRPVSKGHCLIISKRHSPDFFSLSPIEASSLLDITKKLKEYLDAEYCPPSYNLLMNCGARAGQTVFHYHLHVIPRY